MIYDKKCAFCGEPFRTNVSTKKYCCDKCKGRADYKRRIGGKRFNFREPLKEDIDSVCEVRHLFMAKPCTTDCIYWEVDGKPCYRRKK